MQPNYSRKLRINPHSREEMKCWCYIFRCSEKDILSAIEAVGNQAWMVQEYISEKLKGEKLI